MKKNLLPNVCIVLLNYNGSDDTIDCLNSLEKISYANYKIIIVDNASTDNSIEKIQNYLENKIYGEYHIYKSPELAMNCKKTQSKFTLLLANTNGGYGHGNNIGIRYALKNGVDYILILNNDTIVEQNFLEPLVQMCEKDKSIGIASSQIFFENRPNVFWFNGGSYSNYTGKLKHINYNEQDYGQVAPEYVTFITGCLWLIPKDVFGKVGYINEDYFMYVEDLEFSQRVLHAGLKLKISNQSHIYHKVGGSSGGEITGFSMYWMTKNRIKFMKDNVVFLYWPLHLFNNVFSFSLRWLLSGKIDMLKVQINAIVDSISKR